jgi:chemotaxis protein methyltransferase CheR
MSGAAKRPAPGELEAGPRPDELEAVVARVKRYAGLVPDPGGLAAMRRVVRQRMLRVGLTSGQAYLERLCDPREGEGELAELVALLVVQKTSFFRDRRQFDLLARVVLPELVARDRRIHLWSAGCATGEEAYSLAISLRRAGLTEAQARVLATDVARPPLERASLGVFEPSRMAPLSEEERCYFKPRADGAWECRGGLGEMIEFRAHNLLSLPFPAPSDGGWDVVFCRNVLIYFERQTVQEVIRRIHDVLAPGGYLFLGVSESLFQLAEGFELVNAEDAFVYRRRDRAASPRPARAPDAVPVRHQAPGLEPTRTRPPVAAQGFVGPTPGAVVRDPPRPAQDERLVQALRAADRGSLEEARGWLEAWNDEHPLDARAHFLGAVLLFRLGDDDEALRALRRLVYLESGFAMGHFYLGLTHERLGQLEQARRAFRNAGQAAASGHALFQDPMLRSYLLPADALAAACRFRLMRLGEDG